jgi:hypothetical protein
VAGYEKEGHVAQQLRFAESKNTVASGLKEGRRERGERATNAIGGKTPLVGKQPIIPGCRLVSSFSSQTSPEKPRFLPTFATPQQAQIT